MVLTFSIIFPPVEDIFADVADTKLHIMINEVYLNTSKKVLDIVMGPHKLLEHLQAMRKYLLLGQGDLVGLLMEKLKYAYLNFQSLYSILKLFCFLLQT